MFFRLFLIVGVIWIVEISSFGLQFTAVNQNWIRAIDTLNAGQGIIVFVLTVLKKNVLTALADR